QTAVRADLREALDRLGPLAAEIAFDLIVRVDVVAQLRDLVLGQVADLDVTRQPERVGDLLRRRLTDSVDVGEPDLEPLLVRQVHACDTCHRSPLPLTLLVPRIAADDHGAPVPLDHAAALAHGLDGRSDFHGYEKDAHVTKRPATRGVMVPGPGSR